MIGQGGEEEREEREAFQTFAQEFLHLWWSQLLSHVAGVVVPVR
jgi:hypothetical protein